MDGKVGEHIAIGGRKGTVWYIGAMSNWQDCEIKLDMSFLGNGIFEAEVLRDGINADKDATDYKKEKIKISPQTQLKIALANGGGWAAFISPVFNH